MMKKICYPALCWFEDGEYRARFPDLDGCSTWGAQSSAQIIEYAEEALTGFTASLIERGISLPAPTEIWKISPIGERGFVSLVEANLLSYGKSVKKTLTLPAWLNDEAIKRGLNFSQILKNAILQELTT
jgi:predicted RNase H-like HicB family nuclease